MPARWAASSRNGAWNPTIAGGWSLGITPTGGTAAAPQTVNGTLKKAKKKKKKK